ncbi:hypothetical protein [Nocardia flavorosea]|uniref:hypothetical protein n=1 Tax=Nocardia flavorosea TaxID=53429 RepID=UPI0007A4E19C|nr:hypothetical protein [Nocardia flavorosea]
MTATVDDSAPPARSLRSRIGGWATAAVNGIPGPLIIAVLVIDAVIALVLEVLYLPLYIGTVPVPITAILAGPVNLALVWAVATVSTRLSILFLPVGAWLAAFLIAASRGPGGDYPLRSDLPTLLLFLSGAVVPLVYMYVAANRPEPATKK